MNITEVATDKKFNEQFDLVYVVSPSLKTSKDNTFECLPPYQLENGCMVEFLEGFERDVHESGKCALSSLDDAVNDIRKNRKVDKALA